MRCLVLAVLFASGLVPAQSAQQRVAPRTLADVLAATADGPRAARFAALREFAILDRAVTCVHDAVLEVRAQAPDFDDEACALFEAILREHPKADLPLAEMRDVLLEVAARPRWQSRLGAARLFSTLLEFPEVHEGAEERIARVLVPLLASQRTALILAGSKALARLPRGIATTDRFAARTWFYETFRSSVDLHAAGFEHLEGFEWQGQVWLAHCHGLTFASGGFASGGIARFVATQRSRAHARGRTLEVVLSSDEFEVDLEAGTSDPGLFAGLVRELRQCADRVSLSSADDFVGPPFEEDAKRCAEVRAPLASRIAELVGDRVPGAQIAIALPDGTLLEFAHGTADRTTKAPMTTHGRLLAGSIGKTFFSALALQLVGEGRIALDDPVSKWLGTEPWWKRVPNGDRMTLRHLMQHRSGLPRYEFEPAFLEQLQAKPDHRFTPVEELAFVFDKEPRFLPGEGFEYADTNYVLLSLVLEPLVLGDCNDAIEQRFLIPLAMWGTVPSVGRRIPLLLQGHAGEENPFGGRDLMLVNGELPFDAGFEGAGGGFATTAGDLARWAQALYLSPMLGEQRKELLDGPPAPLGRDARYGCGSMLQPTRLGLAVGHSGFFPGWLGEVRAFPGSGISVAILVNSSADLRVVREMSGWVVDLAEAALKK